ncbi:phage integrase family protein [Methylocucumis oryzae]|uniref:phage integrase family protein n=1 Tax=Methylocucumis oryzae TaxID=1632867 RepID=UPI000696A2D0|nr:phage integrase family protein [Methylocucumis oryzae]
MTPSPLLTRDELALLRGWLHGVPLAALSDYCGDETPAPLLSAVRTRLRLKARRLHKEWGDNWLDRPSPASQLTLILSRIDALQQAEDVIPALNQPLSYWLGDDELEKLTPIKLTTVADWLAFVQKTPSPWWQNIAGLGSTTAHALEAQLLQVFPELKIKPAAPPVGYESVIMPLEHIVLAQHLDGRNGTNRSPVIPFIAAEDDYQAIQVWLGRYDPNSHTVRSYRREAERLLLWAVVVKQKPVSSLNVADMSEYRSFLADPQPRELWIGVAQAKPKSSWKPFTGPLSPRSRRYAETVLNNLMSFLVSQHYLLHNPISALPKLKNARWSTPVRCQSGVLMRHIGS